MAVVEFANLGRILKPYSPINLRGGRDASGNVFLEWTRRSRLAGLTFNAIEAALGEAAEQYLLQVYADSTYATVALSYIAAEQAQEISVGDQASAFGSPLPSTIYFDVAQLGALGYGYAARGSV